MPPVDQASVANHILRSLPPEEFAILRPDLKLIHMALRQHFFASGEEIDCLYFVDSGFISVVGVLDDGAPLELGIIGSEGVAGAAVVLGVATAFGDAMTQMEGQAYRISADAVRVAIPSCPTLKARVLRFSHAIFVQVSQTAACNSRHELSERLARWLLSAQDRGGLDTLNLTQEFLSMMLGVRRSTVSVAAGMLQSAGIIEYRQGQVTILDRSKLEDAACECYRVVAEEYRRVLR